MSLRIAGKAGVVFILPFIHSFIHCFAIDETNKADESEIEFFTDCPTKRKTASLAIGGCLNTRSMWRTGIADWFQQMSVSAKLTHPTDMVDVL